MTKATQLAEPTRSTPASPDRPLVLVLHGTGRDVVGTQEYESLVRESLHRFGPEGTTDEDVAALTTNAVFTAAVRTDDVAVVRATRSRRPRGGPRGG